MLALGGGDDGDIGSFLPHHDSPPAHQECYDPASQTAR